MLLVGVSWIREGEGLLGEFSVPGALSPLAASGSVSAFLSVKLGEGRFLSTMI